MQQKFCPARAAAMSPQPAVLPQALKAVNPCNTPKTLGAMALGAMAVVPPTRRSVPTRRQRGSVTEIRWRLMLGRRQIMLGTTQPTASPRATTRHRAAISGTGDLAAANPSK